MRSLHKSDLPVINWNAGKIRDDDLLPLLKLPRVESVGLAHVSITDAGVADLSRALHKCVIEWQPLSRYSLPAR
jgi:hypothetical protein